ncbi:hypothetical protein BST61_g2709 [Cercospora zeina]
MRGVRVLKCDVCRRRKKRCTHVPDQNTPQPLAGSSTAAPKPSLIVKLPIAVRSTPGNAARLEVAKSIPPPDASTHLGSHVLGPPPLGLPKLELLNSFYKATAGPSQHTTGGNLRNDGNSVIGGGNLDVVMQDVESSTPKQVIPRQTLPTPVNQTPSSAFTSDAVTATGTPGPSNRSRPKREAKQKAFNENSTAEHGFPLTLADAPTQATMTSHGAATSTSGTGARSSSKAVPRYTCGVCHKEISSEVWQTCRVCSNVDYHKSCIHEGRRIHHLDFPGHTFMQVTMHAAEEDEEDFNEFMGMGTPAQGLRRESNGGYDCVECDQQITGLRHFCGTCQNVDFCDDHFIAGMEKHHVEHPGHVFEHISSSEGRGGSAKVKPAPENALAAPFAQDGRIARSDTPMAEDVNHEKDPFWSHQRAGPSAFTQSLTNAARTSSNATGQQPPADVSRPRGTSNAMTALSELPQITQTPQGASRTPPQGKSSIFAQNLQAAAARTARTSGRASASELPAPVKAKSPAKRANAAHFSAISEQIAKGVPTSSPHPKSYPAERTTVEIFGEKWLRRLHGYVRSWSESSSASHATHGLQLLSDFQADATLNELLPTHFPDITGVVNVLRNRDYVFTNPFLAAAKAKELARMSVGHWKKVRYHGGAVGGLRMLNLGIVQLQAIDALLEKATRLGMA